MADRGIGKRNSSEFRSRRWCVLNPLLAPVCIAGVLALAGAACSAPAETLVQNRITAPIRSQQMRAMAGTVHPMVALSNDQGQLSGSTVIHGMSLVFRRSAAQEADLKQLLAEQQIPGSEMYHQWLGPRQFAARYGMTASDLAKVASWLQSQGFKIDAIPASADRVDFSGTAARVEAAFQTEMHRYVLHGQTRWANATEISVPQAIVGMTLNVQHLNTFRPTPKVLSRQVHAVPNRAVAALKPNYTLQDGQGSELNLIAPSDSASIYDVKGLYSGGITGAGQTIAIVGQTDILTHKSDIANFRSLGGLNASNMPTQFLITTPNTGPAVVSAGDLAEADLDVEWSGAIAQDANVLYVTVGSDQNYSVFDSLQYAVQNPLIDNNTKVVPVISISYGGCEQGLAGTSFLQQFESILEQANAQGQTVLAAAGDDGSAGCDDSDSSGMAAYQGLYPNYPASSQYVTAVGGTSFAGDVSDQAKYWNTTNNSGNGSAMSYIPETTWNNTPNLTGLNNAGGLSAGGGGASILFSKPAWQVGAGVPADGKRDLPDISLASDPGHDGYVVCTEQTNSAGTQLTGSSTCVYPVGSNQVPYFSANGSGYVWGGTSIAAPQMAAMIALMNQKAGNTNGVGNVNPILYLAAQNTPGAFHDVTTGGDAVVCQQGSPGCISGPGGYVMSCCSAGAGYDLATGLGSVDVAALAAVWPTNSVVTVNPQQPGFTMEATSSAVAVNPGGSTSDILVISPSGVGSNSSPGFSGMVNLTCSNLPAGVTCSFTPGASVALTAGTAQNVTLSLSATSSARLLSPQPVHRDWPMETVLAGVFALSMLGIGRKRRFPTRWASRWMAALLLTAGLMAAAALTACGSGAPASAQPPGQPPSSSTTITVTGTAANATVTAKIQLTIS